MRKLLSITVLLIAVLISCTFNGGTTGGVNLRIPSGMIGEWRNNAADEDLIITADNIVIRYNAVGQMTDFKETIALDPDSFDITYGSNSIRIYSNLTGSGWNFELSNGNIVMSLIPSSLGSMTFTKDKSTEDISSTKIPETLIGQWNADSYLFIRFNDQGFEKSWPNLPVKGIKASYANGKDYTIVFDGTYEDMGVDYTVKGEAIFTYIDDDTYSYSINYIGQYAEYYDDDVVNDSGTMTRDLTPDIYGD